MLTVRHFDPIGREHCCRHRWILTTDPLSVVSRDPYLLNTTSPGAGSHSYVFTTLPKPDLDNQHAAGITPLTFLRDRSSDYLAPAQHPHEQVDSLLESVWLALLLLVLSLDQLTAGTTVTMANAGTNTPRLVSTATAVTLTR